MALRFTDGFDSYAATSDLTKKWGSVGSDWAWSATGGRGGGGGLVGSTTGGSVIRTRPVFALTISGTDVMMIAFWFKASAVPAAAAEFLRFLDSVSATRGSIRVNTSGQLTLNEPFGSVSATGSINVCDGAWHWVAVYTTVSGGGSTTQKCYVDGAAQWSGFLDIASASANYAAFQFQTLAGVTVNLDDIIAWDSDSATAFTTADFPLGARQITTIRPSADSAVQFIPSSGAANAVLVDEVNADTADYVEDGVSGEQDLYTYGDLGFTPAAINAVMLNAYLHNPNAGTINHRQIAKSSTTQTDGTSVETPNSPLVVQEPFYVDPATSAAWDGAGVDGALFGIKVA